MKPPRRVPSNLRDVVRTFFAHGSPRLLGAQVAAAILARPLFGKPTLADAAVVFGVAAYWPMQEWVLHKYVLHGRPIRVAGRDFSSAAARAHERHHDDPLDLAASLLPAGTIAILVPIHVGLWLWLAPSRGVAATGIAALGSAALFYEWIHFLTHTAYKPRGPWFRDVKKRHMNHHHRDAQRWFGFTVTKLDDWLGTGGPPREPARHQS
jgi:hypothetical protein